MKKTALFLSLILTLFSLAKASKNPGQNFEVMLENKFRAELLKIEKNLDGVLGLAIKDLVTGKTFFVNEENVFPQASSIKIAVLFELYKQAEEGRLALDELLSVTPDQKVGGSGILLRLKGPNLSFSLEDLASLMIVLSDNTATNMLIDRLTADLINKRLSRIGLRSTRLNRKMMDLQAAAEGRENISTPREMMTLLEKIWKKEIIKEPFHSQFLGVLSITKESPLADGLPENVVIANKPGALEAVRCDSGLVLLPERPYIICVMTTYLRQESDGQEAIKHLSRYAYEYFSRLQKSTPLGRVISVK